MDNQFKITLHPIIIVKTIIISIICLFNITLTAQNDTTKTDTTFNGHVVSSDWIDHGVSLGLHFSRYTTGDIGYYRSYIWEAGGFPTISYTMNYGLEFSNFDNLILAPKVQGRIHAYIFNTSLTALYYTDLQQNYAIKLRPELGIGQWNFDINYGYNFNVYKKDLINTNKHTLTIRYYLRLHRKHLNEYDKNGNIRPKNQFK